MTARFSGYFGAPLSVAPVDAVIAAMGAFASDGLDGNVTHSSGFSAATVGRDYFFNNYVVDSTVSFQGWRLFCRTLTITAIGILHWDGNNASGATAGAAFTTGSMGPNIAGVNGVATAAAGANGNNANSCVLPGTGVLDGTLFKGGNGGASVGGANAGGTAGTIGVFSSGRTARSNVMTGAALSSSAVGQVTPGSSGGAGAGDGTNAGGGSGSSAGAGFIMAGEIIVISGGVIRARGGNGGNAAGGNAGGGGGGAGGPLFITCGRYTGALPVVTGGTAGSGAGTGSAGQAGKDGYVFFNTFKPS